MSDDEVMNGKTVMNDDAVMNESKKVSEAEATTPEEAEAFAWVQSRQSIGPSEQLRAQTYARVRRDQQRRHNTQRLAGQLCLAAVLIWAVGILVMESGSSRLGPAKQPGAATTGSKALPFSSIDAMIPTARLQAVQERVSFLKRPNGSVARLNQVHIFQQQSDTKERLTAVKARVAAVPPFNPWKGTKS